MIRCLFLLLSTCWFSVSLGQIKQGTMYIRNPYPTYILSSDDKTLGVYEVSEDEQRWCNFLDLTTFAWNPKGSISLKNAFLTPDLKSGYFRQMRLDGFKGDANWLAYDKFLSWYFPSNLSYDKVQWADRNFIIAGRSDGKILTAGQLRLKNVKQLVFPVTTIIDLNVVDPASGKVLNNIRKGEIMQMPHDWWYDRQPQLIDNDKLLVWNFGHTWTSLRLSDGQLTAVQPLEMLDALSGKYGMGIIFKGETNGNLTYRKVVSDMETGRTVHDELISTVDTQGYWCAAGPGNSFYTFTALTSELCKEELIDDKLVVTKKIKLDVNDLDSSGKLQSIDHTIVKLMVSEGSGVVMLLPVNYKQHHQLSNMVMAWKLEDGKQIFKNPNFIRPFQSFLAKEQSVEAAQQRIINAKPEDLPLNALLKSRAGFHVLKSYEKSLESWKAVKFDKHSDGTYSPVDVTLYWADVKKLQCEVASKIACPHCSGAGTVVTTKLKTSEKVDELIYTKVTTTTTQNISTTSTCDHCHGIGFSF